MRRLCAARRDACASRVEAATEWSLFLLLRPASSAAGAGEAEGDREVVVVIDERVTESQTVCVCVCAAREAVTAAERGGTEQERVQWFQRFFRVGSGVLKSKGYEGNGRAN